jgi:CubicO group peptidase (beta-lactamase class C family)
MDTLISFIEETAERRQFSGVISVHGGDRHYKRAFGLMDRSAALPNSALTRFGIASGTKFLTALGVGKLIDRGRLELETPLLDCVGVPLPGVAAEVTIEHLLSHTSGVYDYFDEELIEDFDSFELPIPPFKLKRLRDYLPMLTAGSSKFEPGHRFAYSNGGYIFLGLVIEQVSGSSFQEFIQTEIFDAAGLPDSGFFAFDQLPTQVAHGYIDLPGGDFRSNIYALPIVGGADGGAYTTADDVLHLWTEFSNERILSPELTRKFRTASRQSEGRYGRGMWVCQDDPARLFPYVEGADAGVSFQSGYVREGLSYALLSNTSDGVWPFCEPIRSALLRMAD